MPVVPLRDVVVYPGGSFTLETGATWLYLLEHQELGLARVIFAQFRARPAFQLIFMLPGCPFSRCWCAIRKYMPEASTMRYA